MVWFWIGMIAGILVTAPVAAFVARRRGRRLRAMAQRALQAERLAELATLTAGLAHEIKNPLSTISLNLQLLREDLDVLTQNLSPELEPELIKSRRRFDALSRETQRLRDILDDFLAFAGRMKLELAPVDVNALIDQLADFFEPQAQAEGVHLRTQLLANPATVQADADLLKQALLNLMLNAAQAMREARSRGTPNGGADELIIRTERRRHLGHSEIWIHVTDTGPGLAADVQERVFQPYFSKRRGGTGLGLPRARRIIEEHHGRLSLHTELGRGTDFIIALSASDTTATPPDAAQGHT